MGQYGCSFPATKVLHAGFKHGSARAVRDSYAKFSYFIFLWWVHNFSVSFQNS